MRRPHFLRCNFYSWAASVPKNMVLQNSVNLSKYELVAVHRLKISLVRFYANHILIVTNVVVVRGLCLWYVSAASVQTVGEASSGGRVVGQN